MTSEVILHAAGASSITPREESSANGSKRTLANILWSCISTTIICAWSAIHPNIQPREGIFKTILRRLELLVIAIVAPEFLPAFAFNQLFAAYAIKKLYNEKLKDKPSLSESVKGTFCWQTVKGWFSWEEIPEDKRREWTVAHGFLVLMGGIHLVEPVKGDAASAETEKDIKVQDMETGVKAKASTRVTILTLELLPQVLDEGIEIKVTEEEIANMAKGDALSKTILVLQSSWFIVQCITRAVQGLALTQLELTTLALASLNGITFALWWKKPLGAKTVVRVYLKDGLARNPQPEGSSLKGSYRASILPSATDVFWFSVYTLRDVVLCRSDWFVEPPPLAIRHIEQLPSKMRQIPLAIRLPLAVAALPLFPIVILLIYCIYTLGDVMLTGSIAFPAHNTYVPTFYAPKHDHSDWVRFLVMIQATGFGAIHCAGWNFIFPTHSEEKLWRIASLTVTIIPPVLFIVHFIVKKLVDAKILTGLNAERNYAGFASIPFALTFVAARLVILGQAIALLRHQPPSTFTAVNWSQFYPHIF